MSGHSKWSKIKHHKAAQDGKKSKVFQKISQEIFLSAKDKGTNPQTNSSLRLILLKAKSANMPKSIIEKALNKSKERNNDNWEEFEYEGYSVGGSGFIVKCVSDNRNRTASYVKSIFKKFGGALGSDGAVKYLFNFVGKIYINTIFSEEQMLDILLTMQIENYKFSNDNEFVIFTKVNMLNKIVSLLNNSAEITVENFALEYEPLEWLELSKEQKESCLKMKDELLKSDDVQEVFSNVAI